MQVSVVGVCVR